MTKINIMRRINEIRPDAEIDYETGIFTYTVENGYEKLFIKESDKVGSMEYSGSYHPNVVCEGGGVCKWCGSVM